MIKQEVIDLWRLCFGDTEEFIRFYFDKKYRDENALVYRDEQGVAIAALQMPLYPMAFSGTRILAGYISGACTHPLARGRGVMRSLLKEAFEVMREREIPVSILIPANEWLYDYYGKMGYARVFDYLPERYSVLDMAAPKCFRVEALRGGVEDRVFHYFDEMMSQRSASVQHDREDFNLIVEDLYKSGGALMVVYDEENQVVGMAFAEPFENEVCVKDWLFESEEAKRTLLWGISHHLDVREVICRSLPDGKVDEHGGMARVLDVEHMLRLYAMHDPEQHFCLKVTDEWLPENAGVYFVGEGDCRRDAGHVAGAEVTVQELTRLLFGYHLERYSGLMDHFKMCRPFISLMLD